MPSNNVSLARDCQLDGSGTNGKGTTSSRAIGARKRSGLQPLRAFPSDAQASNAIDRNVIARNASFPPA